MSVVILGGNECMERQYSNVCRKYGCKAKVFCKPCADMKNRIGTPDLLIVFPGYAGIRRLYDLIRVL